MRANAGQTCMKTRPATPEADIAFDTFPYNGGSTSIHPIRQGVPVLTLNGDDWRGRRGLLFATPAGLPKFVATDEDDYVAKAVDITRDPRGRDGPLCPLHGDRPVRGRQMIERWKENRA
jgi:predicted O-linked N-acetylglucosamine transferase (SPINDLY family)